ncbi:hypothetical protein JCM10213_007027 [Rhodosporidiobolus nylandii]
MECNMDNEPTSSSPTASPLLRLPVELLEAIFELAYEEEKPSGPVCRALLPFYLVELYRQVEIANYDALLSFCLAIERSPELGKMVRVFKLGTKEEPAVTGVCDETFDHLLALLPRLRRLVFANLDPDLLLVFLQSYYRVPGLQRLDEFELTPWVDAENPVDDFQPEWLDSLEQYDHLTTLSLHLDEPVVADLFTDLDPPCLPQIRILSLSTSLSTNYLSLDLSCSFPHLETLTITASDNCPDFRNILDEAPRGITSLFLRNAPDCDLPTDDESAFLDTLLPRFKSLEHLELGNRMFSPDSLLAYLRTLPALRTLAFSPGAFVSDELLEFLTEDSDRPPHLKHLRLDYAECFRGKSLEDEGYRLYQCAKSSRFHMYPGWYIADWNYRCSEQGVMQAEWKGGLNGIKVEGTAVEAIGWEEDFFREMYDCTMQWCFEQGDYDEAIGEFGEAAVEMWVECADPYMARCLFGHKYSQDDDDE